MPDTEFTTLKEAAKELRLSVSTLKRYIYAGQLKSYRTPGGRHRLRRSDLAALLGAGPALSEGQPTDLAPLDDFAETVADHIDRALQRRLVRIESDVERLECSLEAIAAVIRRAVAHTSPPAPAPQLPATLDIKVLGPGCRACDHLAALVTDIAHAVGLSDQSISRVREIDEIAEYGPTPMPALIVNNQLVAAGRPPTRSRLTELLRRHRANEHHTEAH
jgi:excisionase family DNA binding protein